MEALAGIVALNEGQDGKPAMPHLPVADALASLTALSGVLMALYRRTQTKQGDYLDISMLESTLAWTPNVSGRVFATGAPPVPKHERSWGGNAMYNVYETGDGQWMVLGGSELKFAKNLLHALNRPDLLHYAALPPGPGQDPLRQFLAATFHTRTRAAWEAWFAKLDVAFAPVRTLQEALDDPELRTRQMTGEDSAGARFVGTPIHFENEPGVPNLHAPALGADNNAGWLP